MDLEPDPGLPPQSHILPPAVTAIIQIEPRSSGSVYTAIVVHGTPEAAKQHDEMGFSGGWATALTQLVAYMKSAG